MKVPLHDFIQNMSQALSKYLSMFIKTEKLDNLKQPSAESKNIFVWALYEFLDGMEHWIKSRYFFGHLKTCTDSVGCASCLQQKRVSNLWVWNFVSLGWLTKSNLPFLRDLSRWSILKNLNWKTSYFRHPK